jgi:uncharacterized membrane protein
MFLISGGRRGHLIVGYPLLSWLGIMMIGWAFGSRLASAREFRPTRLLAIAGVVLLALFGVLRGLDGFGNMALHRTDDSLVQWLHVSKYPPSVTFTSLELGIMALVLAAFFALSRKGEPRMLKPVAVLGSTALFFYLLHVHLLEGAAWALGLHPRLGLGATWLATAIAILVLYYPCVRYQRYKATHDNLMTRYV